MSKSRWVVLATLIAGVVAGASAFAGPKLRPNSAYIDLAACDGGVNGTVSVAGSYVATVLNETVWLCVGDAGCDVAGQPLPSNFMINLDFDAPTAISCRSAGATGEITLTFKAPGT